MVKATVQAENLVKNDSRKPVKGVQWRTLGLLFAALLVPMILFASIADEVHENDTLVVDTAILQYIHTFSSKEAIQNNLTIGEIFDQSWWGYGRRGHHASGTRFICVEKEISRSCAAKYWDWRCGAFEYHYKKSVYARQA